MENENQNVNIAPAKARELKDNTKLLEALFYGSISFAAMLALFLVFYWSLLTNSSITSLINNTKTEPTYLWLYVILTFGTILLFGLNAALFAHRWRLYGPPKFRGQAPLRQGSRLRSIFGGQVGGQAGTGVGTLVGVAASACPVCGSVLLSAVGIAGGLAVFPLQGLELKALSMILMALPIWLVSRDLKNCSDCKINEVQPPSEVEPQKVQKDWSAIQIAFSLIAVFSFISWNMLRSEPIVAQFLGPSRAAILNPDDNQLFQANISNTSSQLFDEVVGKVLPEKGFRSKIRLGDSILKLAKYGVIDQQKFEAIYANRGGLPDEFGNIFIKPQERTMVLTRDNATIYVNLLWPLGLANYMSINKDSPIVGKHLFNFASTGGWNLGKEENGGAYFNKFVIVPLTAGQEALVTKIAKNAYRPCCNNSTFFQDCNHGSALLGLLQLGVFQGLSEDELWREALAFNSFWFPHNYAQTGLYFKAVKNIDWENVDPKVAMGKDFSSISGWQANVAQNIQKLGLLPQTQGGASCGV